MADTTPRKDKHQTAIENNRKAGAANQKPEDIIDYYTVWSANNTYDQDLNETHYTGPRSCADAVCRHLKKNSDVSILDIGAGTGFVGHHLRKQGFRTVDALEPSSGMIKNAEKKGLYRRYHQAFFSEHVDCLKENSYDVLTLCGVLMDGHVKSAALKECIRVGKPGALVVIAMREEYLKTVQEFRDRLEPFMKQLENEGKWQMIERTLLPNYFYNYTGILYVFKVK